MPVEPNDGHDQALVANDGDLSSPAAAAASVVPPTHSSLPACPFPIQSPAMSSEKKCANPSCTMMDFSQQNGLLRCPCRQALYCSRDCQKLHWPDHHSGCKAVRFDQDLDWLKQAQEAEAKPKRPDMRGIDFVPSKNLGCKRYITIRPGVRYSKFLIL